MREESGFTLVEILVSSVIFALAVVGLLSVFSSGGRLMTHARERMTGTELGKFFIDPLQMAVRQDTWDQLGNNLNLSVTPVGLPGFPQNVNNRSFSGTYTTTVVTNTDLRRVTSTITWVEPPP